MNIILVGSLHVCKRHLEHRYSIYSVVIYIYIVIIVHYVIYIPQLIRL